MKNLPFFYVNETENDGAIKAQHYACMSRLEKDGDVLI